MQHLGDLKKVMPEKIGGELAKAGVSVQHRRVIFEALAKMALACETPRLGSASPVNWLRDELRRRHEKRTPHPALNERASDLKRAGADDELVHTYMQIGHRGDGKLHRRDHEAVTNRPLISGSTDAVSAQPRRRK